MFLFERLFSYSDIYSEILNKASWIFQLTYLIILSQSDLFSKRPLRLCPWLWLWKRNQMQIHSNRYQVICMRKHSMLRKLKLIISHRVMWCSNAISTAKFQSERWHNVTRPTRLQWLKQHPLHHMYFRHMSRLNEVTKVRVKKKRGIGGHQTLLLVWACHCLKKRQLNIFTRQFDNILVRLRKNP